LKEMQERESALTQTMNELTIANEQLETSLREARLDFQEQENKWKTKWDRREKMMLKSFEKKIDAHATAVVAAAAEAAEETDQRVQQRYEQMLEKQSQLYKDKLEKTERDNLKQIDELQSIIMGLMQDAPKNKPKPKHEKKGTPGLWM